MKRLINMSDQDSSVKHPFPLNVFKWFLLALSTVYGAVVSIRLWLYRKNILKSRKVPCFVISIGNVVAGGSGKTPMAIYVAEMVKSMGFNPVVVSRGYGGKVEKKKYGGRKNGCVTTLEGCAVAGDGESVFCGPEIVGDEPFMMASRRLFPVVIGRDRFKAAMMALDLFHGKSKNIDVIILDDGFQHIQLKRDLDILLMDYSRPFGNGCLLPAGRLRESPNKAIERADIVIFTRYSDDDSGSSRYLGSSGNNYRDNIFSSCISSHKNPGSIFFTRHRPFLHCFLKQDKPYLGIIEDLKGRKGCLFSGIADNRSFRKTVENLGVSVKAHLEFNDHHMYKCEEISMIVEAYQKSGADLMLTTEKDYARLGYVDDSCESISILDAGIVKKTWSMEFAVIGIEIDVLDKKDELQTIMRKYIECKKK